MLQVAVRAKYRHLSPVRSRLKLRHLPLTNQASPIRLLRLSPVLRQVLVVFRHQATNLHHPRVRQLAVQVAPAQLFRQLPAIHTAPDLLNRQVTALRHQGVHHLQV